MLVCTAQKCHAPSLNEFIFTPLAYCPNRGGGQGAKQNCPQCSLLCTYADDPCCKRIKGEREHFLLNHDLCPN